MQVCGKKGYKVVKGRLVRNAKSPGDKEQNPAKNVKLKIKLVIQAYWWTLSEKSRWSLAP